MVEKGGKINGIALVATTFYFAHFHKTNMIPQFKEYYVSSSWSPRSDHYQNINASPIHLGECAGNDNIPP